MSLPKRPAISISYEVAKLKTILELPITNVVFDNNHHYGSLYVNHDMIGTILYEYSINGLMYDTSTKGKLDWSKVYMQFKDVIFAKIQDQEPLAVNATLAPQKSLYVKDKEGNVIKIAYCHYIKDEWSVGLVDAPKL